MATETAATNDSPKPAKSGRDAKLSPDGKWQSFPKVPNLLQYVSTGTYFGRVKVEGKIFRESLDTDVFTTAKLRLPDFIKKKLSVAGRSTTGTFGEGRHAYEAELADDHTLAEKSKRYRHTCIKALLRTWQGVDERDPRKITVVDCREWAARFSKDYDEQFFNNTLGTLRMILARAGLGHDDNPANKVKRIGVKPKELHLPEGQEFDALVRPEKMIGPG